MVRRRISKKAPTAAPAKKARQPQGNQLPADANARLRLIVRRLEREVGGQSALSRLLAKFGTRWSQSGISHFLLGKRGASYPVALALCELAGADIFAVLGMPRPAEYSRLPRDMRVATYYHWLRSHPDLLAWIHSEALETTVGATFYAYAALANTTLNDEGAPVEGWREFFAHLPLGLAPQPRVTGRTDAVRRAHRKETDDDTDG